MTLLVIYDHPADFPNHWAVRAFVVGAGVATPQADVHLFDTLEGARAFASASCAVAIRRLPDDDPKIAEVWL